MQGIENRECRRVQSLSRELDLSTQEFINAFCLYLDALKAYFSFIGQVAR